MTQAKHTPGPWGMPDSAQGRISKVGANGGWDGLIATADCGDFARSRSEGIANARLIAVAPKMYELLKRYYQETPLGNQPHMIAHEVEQLLSQIEGA